MPKKTFQDVVPPESGGKRSIRNVQITRKSSRRVAPEPEIESVEKEETPISVPLDLGKFTPPTSPSKKSKLPSAKIFGGLVVVVILVFVFIMMNAFTSASVEITPKKETASFTLAVKASSVATSTSMLKYEVIHLTSGKEKEVPANGEEQVSRKASAKVVVYNNFSSKPERLITRTRFQTPEGLIFRINDSIVVPGKTASGPGSIETTVYADEAGDKYNVGLKDFTIPGFKSDPLRYKSIYARSLAPATGGFVGKAKKIADGDKKAALTNMETDLKQDLEVQLASKLNSAMVVLNGGLLYDFSEDVGSDTDNTSGSNAIIKENADLYAIAFDKKELSSLIEGEFLKPWDMLPAEISSYEGMTLTFDTPNWRPASSNSVGVKLTGNAEFVASVDPGAIAGALVGKDKSELAKIVDSSKSIESAEASVRPIWKSGFPEDLAKIKVEIAK